MVCHNHQLINMTPHEFLDYARRTRRECGTWPNPVTIPQAELLRRKQPEPYVRMTNCTHWQPQLNGKFNPIPLFPPKPYDDSTMDRLVYNIQENPDFRERLRKALEMVNAG